VYAAALIIHPVLMGIHGNVDFVALHLTLHDRGSAADLFFVDRIAGRCRIIGKQHHNWKYLVFGNVIPGTHKLAHRMVWAQCDVRFLRE
jgi:hypothetical protein